MGEAGLEVEADGGLLKWGEQRRDEVATLEGAAGEAKAVGIFVDAGVTDGGEAFFEDLVVVDRTAKRAAVVDLVFHGGRGPELGALGRGDESAGGVAEAEEDGVGPAREGEGLGVKTIVGNVVVEEILADHGGRTPAGDVLGGDVDEVVAVAADVDEIGDKGIGIGREVKDLVDVVCAEVIHQLLGENRERGADVAEVGFEAGAAQGLGGEVAFLGIDLDGERRKDEGFAGYGGGRQHALSEER